jgi:predicted membrane protein
MNAVTHHASAGAEGKRLEKTPTTVGHALAGKYDPNKTRIWGHRTLERLRQGSEPTVSRNKFAEVALHWSSGLLKGVTAKGCGPQIFRSEGAVLGKFLVTLGVFCRCARLSEAASPLCTAVLEMLLVCPSCSKLLHFIAIKPHALSADDIWCPLLCLHLRALKILIINIILGSLCINTAQRCTTCFCFWNIQEPHQGADMLNFKPDCTCTHAEIPWL